MPATQTPRKMTPRELDALRKRILADQAAERRRAEAESRWQLANDIASGINDILGRGVIAPILGAPADIGDLLWNAGVWANNKIKDIEVATGLVDKPRYLQYSQGNAYLGSEDIGNRMQQAGLVSPTRRPITELSASLVSPGAAVKTVVNAPRTAMNMLRVADRIEAPVRTLADTVLVPSGSGYVGRTPQIGAIAPQADYRISHRPMTVEGGSSTLDDLTKSFGNDIYTDRALQIFGSGDKREADVLKQLRLLRGNPNKEVTIYRGVPGNAEKINYGDWVTLSKDAAQDYANAFPDGKVISQRVPASHVTAWSDSLLEQGYYPPLTKAEVPQAKALREAQINAAKPVEEGGLGLRPDNTPEERAAAMGFEGGWYHGTGADIKAFNEGKPIYVTSDVNEASRYSGIASRAGGFETVYPLNVRGSMAGNSEFNLAENMVSSRLGQTFAPSREIYGELANSGYDGFAEDGMGVIFDPKNIRSRFAAFDPMRRDSSDLLAGLALPIVAAPVVMANTKDKRKERKK